MFGGKGGVGKTTCAAAAALRIAAERRRPRVLLLSTDPAHSLADVFGQPLSDTERPLKHGPANLFVREIDARRGFAELRGRFASAIDALVDRLAGDSGVGNAATRHDRQVLQDLFDLAPPGVDELIAVIEVTDAILATGGEPPFDLVVIDSAPTGHALRLLEMPGLAHDWVKALMAILLKYQSIVGVGGLGEVLLRLSQRAAASARAAERSGANHVRRRDPAGCAAARGDPAPGAAAARGLDQRPRCRRQCHGHGDLHTMCARGPGAAAGAGDAGTSARQSPGRAFGHRRARLDAGAGGRRRLAPVCRSVATAASPGFAAPALIGSAAPPALSSPQLHGHRDLPLLPGAKRSKAVGGACAPRPSRRDACGAGAAGRAAVGRPCGGAARSVRSRTSRGIAEGSRLGVANRPGT